MQRLHATCVSLAGTGLLITGPSGSGKSDLALRLIDGGALLVADDQVELLTRNNHLIARCPDNIIGLIEARHIGVLQVPHAGSALIAAVLEPGEPATLERIPQPAQITLLGLPRPLLRLPYLHASTPAKIRLWLSNIVSV